MLVHLTASTTTLKEDPDSLQSIKEQILGSGHSLVSDWIKTAHERMKQNVEQKPAVIADENMEFISKADAVIAEVTHDSFGVGYQVAVAMQLNKPVLLLSRKVRTDKMMQGLENGLFHYINILRRTCGILSANL